MHIVHREPCEFYLTARLNSLPRPYPFAVNVETKRLQEAVETLTRYRSMIALLQDQLAAQSQCLPTPATSSASPAPSTTEGSASPESSPLPSRPNRSAQAESPITASPSAGSPGEQ